MTDVDPLPRLGIALYEAGRMADEMKIMQFTEADKRYYAVVVDLGNDAAMFSTADATLPGLVSCLESAVCWLSTQQEAVHAATA